MSNGHDGGNIIHIIGGDEADNQGGVGSGAATSNMVYGGNGAMVSQPSQISTFGSSSFVMVENDGSYKFRYCKQHYTRAGCPFGDNCIYIHDENGKARESLAIVVAPGSGADYWNVAATGIAGGPAAPLPLAPPPLASLTARPPAAAAEIAKPPLAQQPLLAKTVSSATMKPYWRTRLCNKWEFCGTCQFGSNCIFAHGEAELRRYGGGPVYREADQRPMAPNLAENQRAMVQNLASSSGPSADHAVTAPAADAGGSGQMSSAMQGPIPSRNAWKVPKNLIGIYADWIDDNE